MTQITTTPVASRMTHTAPPAHAAVPGSTISLMTVAIVESTKPAVTAIATVITVRVRVRTSAVRSTGSGWERRYSRTASPVTGRDSAERFMPPR